MLDKIKIMADNKNKTLKQTKGNPEKHERKTRCPRLDSHKKTKVKSIKTKEIIMGGDCLACWGLAKAGMSVKLEYHGQKNRKGE